MWAQYSVLITAFSFCRSGLQDKRAAAAQTSGQDPGTLTDVEEGRPLTHAEVGVSSNGAEETGSAQQPYSAEKPADAARATAIGQLSLFGVAILWGSYSPALR